LQCCSKISAKARQVVVNLATPCNVDSEDRQPDRKHFGFKAAKAAALAERPVQRLEIDRVIFA
jgi:hypothetical protein